MKADGLKRVLEFLVIGLMATLVLWLAHNILLLVQLYQRDFDFLAANAQIRIGGILGILLVLLAVVAVLAVRWAGAARALALASLIVIAVATLVMVVFGVIRLVALAQRGSPLEITGDVFHLLGLVLLGAGSVAVLIPLLREAGVRTARPELAPAAEGTAPTWQPDQAVGAHWQTAGQAASGAAAQSRGRPGDRGGWNPAGRTPGAGEPAALPGPSAPSGAAGGPVHQPRDPGAFGPQALAQQYGSGEAADQADMTRIAPSPRRQPPQWTPLERPPEPPVS